MADDKSKGYLPWVIALIVLVVICVLLYMIFGCSDNPAPTDPEIGKITGSELDHADQYTSSMKKIMAVNLEARKLLSLLNTDKTQFYQTSVDMNVKAQLESLIDGEDYIAVLARGEKISREGIDTVSLDKTKAQVDEDINIALRLNPELNRYDNLTAASIDILVKHLFELYDIVKESKSEISASVDFPSQDSSSIANALNNILNVSNNILSRGVDLPDLPDSDPIIDVNSEEGGILKRAGLGVKQFVDNITIPYSHETLLSRTHNGQSQRGPNPKADLLYEWSSSPLEFITEVNTGKIPMNQVPKTLRTPLNLGLDKTNAEFHDEYGRYARRFKATNPSAVIQYTDEEMPINDNIRYRHGLLSLQDAIVPRIRNIIGQDQDSGLEEFGGEGIGYSNIQRNSVLSTT